jgi:uncharacterized membrane protein YdcZ (DUF606 family)
MHIIFIAIAIAAGAILPIQAGSISRLGQQAGGVFNAVLVNFTVGAVAMLALCSVRPSVPSLSRLSEAPAT